MIPEHHAILVRASNVKAAALEKISGEVNEHYFECFGVDDARELVTMATRRPAESVGKVLVVRAEFLTHEAQNALLKILEEPPASTKLIFILPVEYAVLPTLASRFAEVVLDQAVEEREPAFMTFLDMSYKERLDLIAASVKKKDLAWQRAIKQGIVVYLSKLKTDVEVMQVLEFCTRLLLTRGASNKMLLEQIALTLPIRLDQ